MFLGRVPCAPHGETEVDSQKWPIRATAVYHAEHGTSGGGSPKTGQSSVQAQHRLLWGPRPPRQNDEVELGDGTNGEGTGFRTASFGMWVP